MSQVVDRTHIDLAAEWYKQGRCPGCGKRLGEPRGLEYRSRSEDLYCHTCRKSWPIELDLRVLRDELSVPETPQSDVLPSPTADLAVDELSSGTRKVAERFGGFVQRILTRISTALNPGD